MAFPIPGIRNAGLQGCHLTLLLPAIVMVLIAFTPQVAAGDWPTFHQGFQRTGYTADPGPDTGNIRWVFETEGQVSSSPVISDGMIYIGSGDGTAYCLEADTSRPIWEYTTAGPVHGSITVHDGFAYIPTIRGSLHCVSASTGHEAWTFETEGEIHSSPAVVDDRVIFGSTSGTVHCLETSTGHEIWSTDTGSPVLSSPAVAGQRVFIGSGPMAYSLSVTNGLPLWVVPIGEGIRSSPAVESDEVFFATTAGNLNSQVFNLDALTGLIRWQFSNPDGGSFLSSPAITDDSVLIGSDNALLYMIERGSGELIWSFETGGPITSSPALSRDHVYVGCGDGRVYAIRYRLGLPMIAWEMATGAAIHSSPCVVGDKLWVGSMDGSVYCFGPWSPGLPGGHRFTFLRVIKPDGVNDTADSTYRIELIAVVEQMDATFSFYHAPRTGWADPVVIREGIPFLELRGGFFDWVTSGLREDEYYVMVVLEDGNTTLTDWSRGPVTVRHPPRASEGGRFLDLPPALWLVPVFMMIMLLVRFRRRTAVDESLRSSRWGENTP